MAHLESTAMTRSTRATLLMIAMLWQSLVWLTPLGQAQLSTDITNAWVHAQAASIHAEHHHEAAQPLGLAPNSHGLSFDRPQSTPFAGQADPIATVFLQGPLRPPQPPSA